MSDEKPKPHPLHRAWAAGVFESKIVWPKAGFTLRFDSVKEETIRRFHEIVGCGSVKPHDRKESSRTIWIWQCNSMDDLREMLLLLSPFFRGHALIKASELIGAVERNPYWLRNNPEKAASLVVETPKTEG